MKPLSDLFHAVPCLEKRNWQADFTPQGITKDSRQVKPGYLFLACRGPQSDGHLFISQALSQGASVIVHEAFDFKLPDSVTGILVENTQETFLQLLKQAYGYRENALKLIGVTGTNGKTTITQLFYQLLSAHSKAGTVGTLAYQLPKGIRESGNTTPGPEVLIPLLAEMAEQGAEYVSMEISSHALEQRRVHGLQFELAVFTQLTQDHLDYHHDLESYFQAKRKLFSELSPGKMLINRDCPYGRRLLGEFPDAYSFSIESPADYHASAIEQSLSGSRFQMLFKGKVLPVKIKLPLRHNVSNCLAVLAGLDVLGLNVADYIDRIEQISSIAGRMERIDHPQIHFFVDYAHTPDAVAQVLKQVRLQKPNKIVALVGCGGDRDRTKRPLMAKAAVDDADVVIFTSDNPRTEDPQSILDEMKTGLNQNDYRRKQIIEELDREKAIQQAVKIAREGDAVLILGKGHEDYQIIGTKKNHFSDREVLVKALQQ